MPRICSHKPKTTPLPKQAKGALAGWCPAGLKPVTNSMLKIGCFQECWASHLMPTFLQLISRAQASRTYRNAAPASSNSQLGKQTTSQPTCPGIGLNFLPDLVPEDVPKMTHPAFVLKLVPWELQYLGCTHLSVLTLYCLLVYWIKHPKPSQRLILIPCFLPFKNSIIWECSYFLMWHKEITRENPRRGF